MRLVINSPDGSSRNLRSNRDGRDVDLSPATYEIYAWEPSENIEINGRTVAMTLQNGQPLTPQQFGAGAVTGQVYESPDYQIIPLPMRRQAREIIVDIFFSGEGVSLIEAVSGSISGLALSRDINNGFPPADGSERPDGLTQGAVNYDFNSILPTWYQGSRFLIGNYGQGEQFLDLEIDFRSGNIREISVEVTPGMDGYHTVNVDEPWYLQFYIDVGISLEVDIIDWIAGGDSVLEAS